MRYRKIVLLMTGIFLLGSGLALGKMTEEDWGSVPDSHRSGWTQKHQQYAKSGQEECSMCHKPIFCIDCHQRRDDVTERVHKRNWKFFHSVEARANPRKCDSCHQTVFCTRCHQNPK